METETNRDTLDVALKYIKRAQSFLLPALARQSYGEDQLFSLQSEKSEPNPSYQFDEISNQMLFNVLEEQDFSCHVFSEEEHAWKTVGDDPQYYVICDPYCNSFLTSHTFRDSAVAICISDLEGNLVACAIGDLQVERIYYATSSGAYLLEYHQEKEAISKIQVSDVRSVENAFVVTPLLKSSRRKLISSFSFFYRAKIIHGVDGAIMIGRLAAGHIDAYLDPVKGQPLYEIPCCELILKAGGIVTDENGHPFDLREVILSLGKKNVRRYKLIAACSRDLHLALLEDVKFRLK